MQYDENLLEQFVCPITLELLTDPVITPSGVSYERQAIEDWIDQRGTDPMTGQPLTRQQLYPNRGLLAALHAWQQSERDWRQRIAELQQNLRAAQEQDDDDDDDDDNNNNDNFAARERTLLSRINFWRSRLVYAPSRAPALSDAQMQANVREIVRSAVSLADVDDEKDDVVEAQMLLFDNRFDEAIELLMALSERAASPRVAAWALVQASYAMSQRAKQAQDADDEHRLYLSALARAERAVQLDDTLADAHRLRGWMLMRVELTSSSKQSNNQSTLQAIDCFRRALEIEPNNVAAIDNLVRALRAIGDNDAALAECERGLSIAPLHSKLLCSAGEICKNMSLFVEAIEYYRRAVEADAHDEFNHYKLALALEKYARERSLSTEKRCDLMREAVAELRAALDINPQHQFASEKLPIMRRQLEKLEHFTTHSKAQTTSSVSWRKDGDKQHQQQGKRMLQGQALARDYHRRGRCRSCRRLRENGHCERKNRCTFCHNKDCVSDSNN